MFEQQEGIVIQTEDSFLRKETDAVERIGHHLLIMAVYKKGAVIGNRFDSRQNEEQQWIKVINSGSLIVGLGQQGAFESFCRAADSLKLSLTSDFLPKRYMTLAVYDKFLTPLFRSSFEAGKPVALDIIYADLRSKKPLKIKSVRFNGDSARYAGFGILGGYGYIDAQVKDILKKEDMEGKSEEQVSDMVRRVTLEGYKIPVKGAIKKMESFFGEKNHLDTMEEAMDAVKSTLFEFDPPSKKETFEFTVFEKGELISTYTRRPAPVAIKIEIADGNPSTE